MKSRLIQRIQSAKSLLVLTHARPDGDGLGSMSALACAAQDAGKRVRCLVPGDLPPRYEYLFDTPPTTDVSQFTALADDSDLIVILDTSAYAQLDGMEDALRERRDKIAIVDHHQSSDDVCDLCWRDTTAAATGVMMVELLEQMQWNIGTRAAEALMTAISTDTGWFRFSNTDGRTLRAAADLLDDGVKPDSLYRRIFQNDRPERLALNHYALASLDLRNDDRLAAMTIRKTDFEKTGARHDETENLVNEAMRLASIEAAMLLTENDDCIRVSLRSREQIDVSEVAKQFGGGGHRRAAGCRVDEDIDVLKEKLLSACASQLKTGA